jgi:hypothetical protein
MHVINKRLADMNDADQQHHHRRRRRRPHVNKRNGA